MIGVDEVGRGCWAGPLLVVAARQKRKLPARLHDSKQMTSRQREKMFARLGSACDFGEGWVQPAEIDYHGLSAALRLGAARALKAVMALPLDEIIVDGKVNYLPESFSFAQAVVKADEKVPIVSAASVHAKVARDRYMVKLAKKHPGFNFEENVGYGTASHRRALVELGAIDGVHRLSFKPLAGGSL